MKAELENFTIESDTKIAYFDDIVNYIVENEKRILDFFKLKKLPQKIKIMILSYEPFKEFIVAKYGEILDYVRGDADAKTHSIRMLNIEDQIKYTKHKNADIDKMKDTALHEIIHQCHMVYHTDYRQTTWFAEGLATNIAHQNYELRNLNECDFEELKKDFKHYKGSYGFAHTIVNYVLNHYSEKEITKLYSDPDYLRDHADLIFNEAKEWSSSIKQ